MSQATTQAGTIGLAIRLAFGTDITTASKVWFVFSPPQATKFVRDAAPASSGVPTQADYITRAGDLDLAGTWRVQGFARFASGDVHPTKVSSFLIEPNIGTSSLDFASVPSAGLELVAHPLTVTQA